MDVLLVDPLVPEALVWLQERHDVVYQPDLADDPVALRRALADSSRSRRELADLMQSCPALALSADPSPDAWD